MFVILLATYNGENYIEQQIDSILAQSYDDWQLIISDDGSKDGTVSIIEKYTRENSDKIKLIKNESAVRGAFGNFMNLINQAPEGDYYAFCDQDDEWYVDKLEIMAAHFQGENSQPLLVYHDLKVIDKNGEVLGESFREYTKLGMGETPGLSTLMKYNITPGCSVCFNHRLRQLIKTPRNSVSIHDWWTMLVAASFGSIAREDRVLGIYRQHDNNTLGISEKSTGIGLAAKYLKPGRIKWVFGQIKSAKIEAYAMLKEFERTYGSDLKKSVQSRLKLYIHHLESGNKLAAVFFGLKKQNRQKGFIKNIYYWTVKIK